MDRMEPTFKRGDLGTVRSNNRRVQVHRVRTEGGKTVVECKGLDDSDDDGTYRPSDLIPCIGLAPVLPPE